MKWGFTGSDTCVFSNSPILTSWLSTAMNFRSSSIILGRHISSRPSTRTFHRTVAILMLIRQELDCVEQVVKNSVWCRARSKHFRFSAVRATRYDQESVQIPPIGHHTLHATSCTASSHALMRPARGPAPSPLLPTNSASQIRPLLFVRVVSSNDCRFQLADILQLCFKNPPSAASRPPPRSHLTCKTDSIPSSHSRESPGTMFPRSQNSRNVTSRTRRDTGRRFSGAGSSFGIARRRGVPPKPVQEAATSKNILSSFFHRDRFSTLTAIQQSTAFSQISCCHRELCTTTVGRSIRIRKTSVSVCQVVPRRLDSHPVARTANGVA